jgi:hypothetical protein
LLTKVSNKAAAQANLDKIAAAIEKSDKKGEIKFQPKTVDGVTFKQATKPASNIAPSLGAISDYVFLRSSDEQAQAIIAR